MLYVVQGLLPCDQPRVRGVSPRPPTFTLSLTTLPLALAVLVAAAWSEGAGGRRHLLVGSLLGAGTPHARRGGRSPSFSTLLVLRILTGIVLAGFPAVAMAYVAEEFHPSGLGTGRWVSTSAAPAWAGGGSRGNSRAA